jgi:hypothetical protein
MYGKVSESDWFNHPGHPEERGEQEESYGSLLVYIHLL